MSLVDAVGLAAAEQLERSMGPRVALASYRTLLHARFDPTTRAKAAAAALRCALDLADFEAIRGVAAMWSELGRASLYIAAREACLTLVRMTRIDVALDLAKAESERAACGPSLYLYARVLEARGKDLEGALSAYEAAADHAANEPDGAAIAVACRARVYEAAVRRGEATGAAAKAAEGADLTIATGAQKLWIARAQLGAASRFKRASALSTLEELSREPSSESAAAAIHVAAAHADAAGDALTSIEADRIAAALGHVTSERDRDRALARLAARMAVVSAAEDARDQAMLDAAASEPESLHLIARAQRIALGGETDARASRADPSDPVECLAELGMNLVVALGRGDRDSAAFALEKANGAAAQATWAPAPLWTGAVLALGSALPDVSAHAAALCDHLLLRGRTPPPRGYLALSAALRRAHQGELSMRALRRAEAAKEPGAKRRLAETLRFEGYRLAEAGERERAIERLEEARRLFA